MEQSRARPLTASHEPQIHSPASQSASYVSTLLVNNIHCPSCVSYVEDILRVLPEVVSVNTSVVDHTVRVTHQGTTGTARAIAEELKKAAFEVQHGSVRDRSGRVVASFDLHMFPKKSISFHTWPLSKAQRKHIENCSACKAETQRKPARRFIWAATRRNKSEKPSEEKPVADTSEDGNETLDGGRQDGASVNGVFEAKSALSDTFEAVISIGGMTCASCIRTISKELEAMELVQSVSINLIANNAVVVFSGSKSNTDKIVEAIEDVGYEAIIDNVKQVSNVTNTSNTVQNAPRKYRAVLSIEGMTCGSCVGTITRGLKELPLIEVVNIDLIGNIGMVEYVGEENLQLILEKIDDLGYDALTVKAENISQATAQNNRPKERTVSLQIDGMFCEHCPGNVVSALGKAFQNSIKITQKPTLRNPRIIVSYTPAPPRLSVRRLVSVINSAHEAFSTNVYHPPSIEERSRAMQRREQRRLLWRVIFTFTVAVPTFIIGIVFMSLVPSTNSSKRWLEQIVWKGNVTREEWALFIMTTPVMFFGADVFHTRALTEIKALWRRGSKVPILKRFYRFGSMNLLISLGTSIAYFSSLAVLITNATMTPNIGKTRRSSTTYFDSVTFLSLFILCGRFLEAYSKAKAGDAVAMLSKLRGSEALLVEEVSRVELENDDAKKTNSTLVAVDMLEVGDTVNVTHGASPPTDGLVAQEGIFLFDESSLTGESRPVKKVRGDQVFAGAVNISDPVRISVTEIGGTSMLDKIINVVREGQAKRAPIERIADIITGYFTPIVTLIAITTWLVWLGLGESGTLPKDWLDVQQGGWAFWSLEFAIAVFVVACPCGIGLAAPTALFVGGGLAAKHGILVQGGGEAFQEASRLDVIVFDKTGTLTQGNMQVTNCENLNQQPEDATGQAIALLATKMMEESSSHPIAKAIVEFCAARLEKLPEARIEDMEIKEVPGQGMTCSFSIRNVPGSLRAAESITHYEAAIGNQRLLASLTRSKDLLKGEDIFLNDTLSKFQNLGHSTAIFSIRKGALDVDSSFNPEYVFSITDPLRPTTASVIHTLQHTQGLEVHMCTGDNETTARAIATQVGIPATNIRAGVLPQDKAAYIQSLQTPSVHSLNSVANSAQKRRRIVAFVGDGTNDTPALSAADVSVALSSGSDVAVSTASFILLNSDLTTILALVRLSKRVFRRVKLNFAWAAVYNVCLVPIAAGVTYPAGRWRLSPVWASAAMAASSISVVLSSLALRAPEVDFRVGRKAGPKGTGYRKGT